MILLEAQSSADKHHWIMAFKEQVAMACIRGKGKLQYCRGGGPGANLSVAGGGGGALSPTNFSEASRVKSIVNIKREESFLL